MEHKASLSDMCYLVASSITKYVKSRGTTTDMECSFAFPFVSARTEAVRRQNEVRCTFSSASQTLAAL
jgi:hypothetical protein